MSGILSATGSAPQKVHPPNFLAAGDRPNDKPALEGTIPFAFGGKTYQTWYKIYGDPVPSKSVPLVVVHGGKL